MKIPKVIFFYSRIYDSVFCRLQKKREKLYDYKEIRKLENKIKKLERLWRKHEKKILKTMCKITGLNWKKDFIECWISQETPFSFSHPLTIKLTRSEKRFIQTLVHELAHILIWENRNKIIQPWQNKGIYKKYKNEHFITKLHLLVEAIVKLTLENVFGKDAKKFIKWEKWWKILKNVKRGKFYAKAWEIVEKEGAEKVIRNLIKVKK